MGTIEWTDATWNPVIGCARVSEGCRHCYAETMAGRLARMGRPEYEGLTTGAGRKTRWTGVVRCLPERLGAPLGWRKPRRIFVNSMSDLFHPAVPFEFIAAVFGVMAACPQHTFQVLTKRPERAVEFFERAGRDGEDALVVVAFDTDSHAGARLGGVFETGEYEEGRCVLPPCYEDIEWPAWPLPNVHIGVSVEDQATADERIPHLLQCPAAVRWVSAEPLLGAVDFSKVPLNPANPRMMRGLFNPLMGGGRDTSTPWRIDWVVCGGESGPGARPMHPDWARSLRDQCSDAGVAFNFKQWGAWVPNEGAGYSRSDCYLPNDGKLLVGDPRLNVVPMERVGKSKAGRLLDGVLHDAYPDAP